MGKNIFLTHYLASSATWPSCTRTEVDPAKSEQPIFKTPDDDDNDE